LRYKKRLQINRELDQELLKASIGPRMPRNYRTPDLVEYYKGGPAPTNRSDVYQLGLLFAEMFSGINPQRRVKTRDFTEPVRLRDFSIKGGLSEHLKNAILPMLDPDPDKRPTVGKLGPIWQGLFLKAAKDSHNLEGRVL
jgi:serine/threonine protein kinase